MGRKKRKGGRRGMSLAPIDKKGLKLATLMTELGIAVNVAQEWDGLKTGSPSALWKFGESFINFNRPGTKLMWTGIGLKLAGRFVPQLRDIGIVGFR